MSLAFVLLPPTAESLKVWLMVVADSGCCGEVRISQAGWISQMFLGNTAAPVSLKHVAAS